MDDASRFSAALSGTNVEGGPSNLLVNKKTTFRICAYEPSGREFESLRARKKHRGPTGLYFFRPDSSNSVARRATVRQNGRIAVLDREAARRVRDMDVPNQSLRARQLFEVRSSS